MFRYTLDIVRPCTMIGANQPDSRWDVAARSRRAARAGRTPRRNHGPMPGEIDQLDARLLLTLRALPRIGLLEVSRRLGVARGTVQARLEKLQARGVITGFG